MSRQELVKESVIVRSILNHLKSMPDCFAWKEHGGMYGTAGIPEQAYRTSSAVLVADSLPLR